MTVFKPKGRKTYLMKFRVNGQEVRRSTFRTNKKEAQQVEDNERRKLLDAHQLGKLPEISLRAAVNEWWQDYGKNLRDAHRIEVEIRVMFGEAAPNARTDGRTYKRLRQWAWDGDRKLSSINDADLKRFVNTRIREGLSAASILAEVNILRRTVNRLSKLYNTPKDLTWPSPRDDKRIVPNKKMRFLSQEEIKALFSELSPDRKVTRKGFADYRTKALSLYMQDAHDIALFMLHTGCRPDEAYHMLWSDIHFKTGKLMLERLKSTETLWTGLVMSNRLREMLIRRKTSEPVGPYIFPDRKTGGPRKQCRAIERAIGRAGLNEPWKVQRYGGKVTMYTLRDTYASQLAQSGKVTLHELRDLLGHTDVKTTQKYARLIPGQAAANAAATLDGLGI